MAVSHPPDGSRIAALKVRGPAGGELNLAAGETPVSVQPQLSSRTAPDGQRRLNAFAGRALTAPLLKAEQDARARRLALLNRALSAGVVEGLGLAFDDAQASDGLDAPRRMTLEAGFGLVACGEEVIVPAAISFDALALPVVAPLWLLNAEVDRPGQPPQADGSVLFTRTTGAALRTLIVQERPVPRVGLVLLEPIELPRIEGFDPRDQCERDLDAEAFEDQVRQDAIRLVYYAWPDEWLPLPAPGEAWRNALAHRIFEREAAMGSSQAMPWHAIGAPVGLVAFDDAWNPLFADRAAVVRAGGRPRGGPRFLWQARVEQLGEHLAEAAAGGASSEALARQLLVLPPAGLLPRDAVDARAARQRFFPSTLDVVALPLPMEQLDHVFEAAAGLAPIDLAVRDSVCVYVPVPQSVWEPGLLLTEVADADGSIANAIEQDVEARADWLRRRQRMRELRQALQLAVEGPLNADPVLPAADDPAKLEEERLESRVSAPAGLLHRSARVAGYHRHYLAATSRQLELRLGDTLYAWVLLDREVTPRELMLEWQVDRSWEHRAYWGENLIGKGIDGTPSRLQQSRADPPALPTLGVWQRLEMNPIALDLQRAKITGVAFTLFDGQAVFGPCGVLRAGEESAWLDAAVLAAGTVGGEGENWSIVADTARDVPFEEPYGTEVVEGRLRSSELAKLRTAPLVADRLLAPVTGDDSKLFQSEKSAQERGFRKLADLLTENGLRATVADLESRIEEADDAINLGYLRVQTDLYRLRQTVLKSSQASRFAVSPALTQIADLDNASATREQLSEFYDSVRNGNPVKLPEDRKLPPKFTRGVSTDPNDLRVKPQQSPSAAPASASNITSNVGDFDSSVAYRADAPQRAKAVPATSWSGDQSLYVVSRPYDKVVIGAAKTKPPAAAPPPSANVTDSSALTGKAEIRTTSIASRMERPRAIEAKDFTVGTRLEVIGKLSSLGLDLDGLDVPGIAKGLEALDGPEKPARQPFDAAGQPARQAPKKLRDLRKNMQELAFDPDPEDIKRDESAYFLGGVDLSDHTIAVLRTAEGIVRGYRDALVLCRKTLMAIDTSLASLAPRLALLDSELAEARQDVATARALLAEEIRRAQDLNAQRDRIVAEHATFLAFARPRLGVSTAGLPWRALDNALEPDAVPACLAAHDEPPGDVAAMLGIVRQAPADWFPAVRGHLALIDSHLAADRLLASLPPAAKGLSSQSAYTLTVGMAGGASQKRAFDSVRAQADAVGRARAEVFPVGGLTLSTQLGLVEKIGLIARGAALADLAAIAAGRDELNRRVTAELGRIAQIATCLHARLSSVRAGIRLDWAERFSQFDTVGDLGDLSTLPRMGELVKDDRDDIVELAAWLRGRVDRANPRAVTLMAALVRVCLLAASHSPAGQLLTGRLVRPVPLHPGVRFEVQPAVADRLRVGMSVKLFDTVRGVNAIAAQAVVADVIGGIAHVSVTNVVQAGFIPSARASAHFLLV